MAGVALYQIQVETDGEAPGLNPTQNMDMMDQLVIIILMVHIIFQFRLPLHCFPRWYNGDLTNTVEKFSRIGPN